MLYREIDTCRSCGSKQMTQVLDLGLFAISDFLESPDAFVDKAPLVLVRCQNCTLVQLLHTVDRERLYHQYWYRSGTQPAMVSALRDVVDEARLRVALQPGDAVLDIGANDGTLLRMYPEGIRRIAFEPAENLWPFLQGNSRDGIREISTIHGYFPQIVGGKVVGMEPGAKIITSCACFYDVDDPGAFVEGIKACLAEDGVWINQMAYLPDTLRTNNFGDICHEHLTYWTVQSFSALLGDYDLYLNDYSFNDVNGGSIRTIVSRMPVIAFRRDAPSVLDFARFSGTIEGLSERIGLEVYLLTHSKHKLVIGYGASTKGNTYLQRWDGITPRELPYIADRNPDKWGKYTPTGQKVISEEEMRAMKADYLLILPWHFLDAFMDREKDLLASGTRMIVPFPELRVLGGADAHLQSASTPAGV